MLIAYSTVTIGGNSKFADNSMSSSIYSIYSNITLSGNMSFINNSALSGGAIFLYLSSNLHVAAYANVTFFNNSVLSRGGALYLLLSTLNIAAGSNVTFVCNSARDKGGAIFVEAGITAEMVLSQLDHNFVQDAECFYQCNEVGANYMLFANNSAENGGDDLYGAPLQNCESHCLLRLDVDEINTGISPVSSDPLRVCVCDRKGVPQCNNTKYIYLDKKVRPGEGFMVSVLIVGVDYGSTTGVVHTNYIQSHSSDVRFDSNLGSDHMISSSKQCTNITYSLLSNHTPEIGTMYMTAFDMDSHTVLHYLQNGTCFFSHSSGCVALTPIFINVTLLPCPPGFTLLNQRCDCYLHGELFDNCSIVNGTGYFSWTTNAWVRTYEDGILYNNYCPFDILGNWVDLSNNYSSQCALNRNGTLCGGCREDYSLAIGSSHCIHCPDNNNLALLIFFAAAGFLLVFFVSALNLTVSQGMVNGLIFYANIIWTQQSIFFPDGQGSKFKVVLIFLKTFIAWVNLDFGIETCFIRGLSAFTKTWLQFIFPFYVWGITGLIIIAARYSTRLTAALGNRIVSVLDTLFLLSYIKLLRIVVTTIEFSVLTYVDRNSTVVQSVVWSPDGNLYYFRYPHILLFVVGLATLLFLCLPFTILLLLMQWIRRLSHFKLVDWIMRLHPVYDAYFAPLKPKHQYCLGALLLARVILLLTSMSNFAIPPSINLLILQVFAVVLTIYIALVQPYKSLAVMTSQILFFANLTLVAAFVSVSLQSHSSTLHEAAITLSAGVAFSQFGCIVFYAAVSNIKQKVANRSVLHDLSDACVSFRQRSRYSDSRDQTEPLLSNESSDGPTC